MNKPHGQISIELMIGLVFMFLLFLSMQSFFMHLNLKILQTKEGAKLSDYCNSISSLIFDAQKPGFQSNIFYVPQSMNGNNVTVMFFSNYLLINADGADVSCMYLYSNISYLSSPAPFTLPAGSYYLKNSGGLVILNA